MNTRILQFGEGVFLRCFFDWMVQCLNDTTNFNGRVTVVQPRSDELSATAVAIKQAQGIFHTCLRGFENGQTVENLQTINVIDNVYRPKSNWTEILKIACSPDLRFVVSNTTEAGIVYRQNENTFPYKVACILKARFEAGGSGLVFLPCELIERNGQALKNCVLQYVQDWGEVSLANWIENNCVFCDTLVDRIISGLPDSESLKRYTQKIGYEDKALVCGEPFHFWAIQAPEGFDLENEMPLKRAGLNVVYTSDLALYRTRKVRFLNGAHTSTIPEGLVKGFTEVDQLVANEYFNNHFKTILWQEIAPTLDLPQTEKDEYAQSVLNRFANPFAHHKLAAIALNSVSKWKVRVLPTILDYVKIYGTVPKRLTASFAWLYKLYSNYPINDSEDVVKFFNTKPSPQAFMQRVDWWGIDLSTLPNFQTIVMREITQC